MHVDDLPSAQSGGLCIDAYAQPHKRSEPDTDIRKVILKLPGDILSRDRPGFLQQGILRRKEFFQQDFFCNFQVCQLLSFTI